MKEKIYAISLFAAELLFYYMISLYLKLPISIAIRYGTIWFIFMFAFNHYKVQSSLIWDEIKNNVKASIYYIVMIFFLEYPGYHYILKMIVIGITMFIIAILINRTARIIFRGILARKTLIIGTGYDAYRIGKIAHNNRFALTNVKAFVKMPDDDICEEIENDENARNMISDFDDLERIVTKSKIDQVIIAIPEASSEYIEDISKKIFDKVRIIKVLPELNFMMTFYSKIDDFDGELLVSTSRGSNNIFERFVKRTVDICAGICGCLLLVPLTLFVRHKNRQTGDYESVFFKQERIGKNGKPIQIYKYRSMVPNAEKILEELMENDPAIREEYLTNKKIKNDPRVTEAGKILRRTSLDEFPQFINVLKGEMSLVGPRPYLYREIEDMDVYYQSIIKCKPGITGMWQANGRSDVGFIDRCKLDDYYYRNYSLWLDFIIIYKTVKSVLYGKGAL